MKYCTNCGTRLADEAAFCSGCGTKQEENQQSLNGAAQPREPRPEAAQPGKEQLNLEGIKKGAEQMAGNIVSSVNTAMGSQQAQAYLTDAGKLMSCAYGAGLAAGAAIFLPMVQMGFIEPTLFQLNKPVALVVILIVGLFLHGINSRQCVVALAGGQAYLLSAVASLAIYEHNMSQTGGFGSMVSIGSGYYLAFLGGFAMVITAALLALALQQRKSDVGAVLAAIKELNGQTVSIGGNSLNTVMLSALQIGILMLVSFVAK